MNPIEHVRLDTLQCLWDTPKYLFFSDGVDAIIYYSHFFPTTATIILLFILFFSQNKSLQSIQLSIIAVLFIVYTLLNVLLWSLIDPSQIMFYWTITNYIEPLIYVMMLYLVLSYGLKSDLSLKIKILLGTLFLPIILFGPTHLNLVGYDYTNCDRLAVEGPLISYIYLLEIFFALWILIGSIIIYKKIPDQQHRRSFAYLTTGSLLCLLAFSSGNIFGTFFQESLGEKAWLIGQYGFFGMPIFLGFIMYIIVRFKVFNTKIIATQALVLTLWVLVGSLLFVAQSTPTKVISSITLFLISIFGYSLARSVKREIQQREQIEGLVVTLNQANERLKVLDKMKSEFVSIASHQLRSPLTSIRGYTSMLIEGSYGKLPQKATEALHNINDSARFMALSIEDYLNISRIESGRMKYETTDFNIKNVAEKIVDEIRPVALKRGLVLVFRSDCDGTAMIHADIGKTRQVIINLIDNAIKYTPKGTITVFVHDDIKKKRVTITIKDTGVGISKESQEELFEKFVRAKNAHCVNVTGTGLGLYVAKKIVIEMGGEIWVESEGEGKGSTFHVSFPLVFAKKQAVAPKQPR